jgi:hypothetical protein
MNWVCGGRRRHGRFLAGFWTLLVFLPPEKPLLLFLFLLVGAGLLGGLGRGFGGSFRRPDGTCVVLVLVVFVVFTQAVVVPCTVGRKMFIWV